MHTCLDSYSLKYEKYILLEEYDTSSYSGIYSCAATTRSMYATQLLFST